MTTDELNQKPWLTLTRTEYKRLVRAYAAGDPLTYWRNGTLMMSVVEWLTTENDPTDEIRFAALKKWGREIWHLRGPLPGKLP